MKLTLKDLITVGVFTVLYYLCQMIFAFVGVIPLGSLFVPAIAALVVGPIFFVYITKVKKLGALTITGVIISAICFMGFGNITMTVLTFLPYLLGDLIAYKGKYISHKTNTFAYMVVALAPLGISASYWYMFDVAATNYLNAGGKQEWLDGLQQYLTTTNIALVILGTLFCAFLSAGLSKKILNKHFKKAGIN